MFKFLLHLHKFFTLSGFLQPGGQDHELARGDQQAHPRPEQADGRAAENSGAVHQQGADAAAGAGYDEQEPRGSVGRLRRDAGGGDRGAAAEGKPAEEAGAGSRRGTPWREQDAADRERGEIDAAAEDGRVRAEGRGDGAGGEQGEGGGGAAGAAAGGDAGKDGGS